MNAAFLTQLSLLLLSSFLVALAALWLLAFINARTRRRATGFMMEPDHAVAFLFDDEFLVNATEPAKQILSGAAEGRSEWNRLMSLLLPKFPSLLEDLEVLAEDGRVRVVSQDGTSQIDAEWRDGLARLCLVDSDAAGLPVDFDRHSLAALQRELETLRLTADHAPVLMWRQRPDGVITWANAAYLDLSGKRRPDGQGTSWPPARLFDVSSLQDAPDASKMARLSIKVPTEPEPRWFDCCRTAVGDESLFMAVTADKTVHAEVSLREFVQTLTKTFAHLTVGLAIFDKSRKLTLFNPALADLTHLPPEFLIARPSLQAMLDRLREKRIIPEPKDYKSWRQRMYELETEASNGTYEETWSLASGQTYRVTGRPHPDGAVAFLFEDISAEISLTRRFRAELETGQAVLDSLDEAIAVFSPSGSLTLSNSAYARLWGFDPTTTIDDFGIADATRAWSEKCAPTPVWGDLREFVASFGERAEWAADIRLRDGRQLGCRFAPLSGGATLVGFQAPTRRQSDDSATGRSQDPRNARTISA
jgi:PAS domain-containing protein